MFLTPYENKGQLHWHFWEQGVVYQDCNKVEMFVKSTTQLLIIRNSQKYDFGDCTVTYHLCIRVSLQIGEATIHRVHLLESTTWFECQCVLCSLLGSF